MRSAPQQLGRLPVRQRHPADADNDPRYVVLIVTDIDLFNGGGAGQVPIRKFAGFYVTGWSNASNACNNASNNEAPPPGLTFDNNIRPSGDTS